MSMHLLIQKQWIDQVRIHFDAHFTYVLPSTQSQSPRSSVFTLPLFEYYPNGVNPLSLCTHQYEYNGFVFNSDFNFMQIITITHQDPKNIVRCSLTLRHLNSRYVYYTHALLPFKTLGMSITPTLYCIKVNALTKRQSSYFICFFSVFNLPLFFNKVS